MVFAPAFKFPTVVEAPVAGVNVIVASEDDQIPVYPEGKLPFNDAVFVQTSKFVCVISALGTELVTFMVTDVEGVVFPHISLAVPLYEIVNEPASLIAGETVAVKYLLYVPPLAQLSPTKFDKVYGPPGPVNVKLLIFNDEHNTFSLNRIVIEVAPQAGLSIPVSVGPVKSNTPADEPEKFIE